MPITITRDDLKATRFDSMLQCPHCGDTSTHVDRVEVHTAGGNAIRIEGHGEDNDATYSATPIRSFEPYRRHHVRFYIECEICKHETRVILQQLDGSTIVEVR
jgi:hypothetical protein